MNPVVMRERNAARQTVDARLIGRACSGSRTWTTAALLALATLAPASLHAEPYFAVRQGVTCVTCHVNATGGGLRNEFGNTWGQRILPARSVETGVPQSWTGKLNPYLGIGANLRVNASYVDAPNQPTLSEFDVQEMRVYLLVDAIPKRLSVYVDERIAPDEATNREAWARYWFGAQRWYVKAGQMYLPFGLRLEDQSAFVRALSGINMATPDRGVEIGFENAAWSAQLAVINGVAGGDETDRGKQAILRAEHVQSAWRAGASYSYNDTDEGDRQLAAVFAGVRTGPVAWLAEADYSEDDGVAAGRLSGWAGLLEANWGFRQGHNLKFTAEYLEPDDEVDDDEQNRWSLLWEYTPMQFLQLRVGARLYDGKGSQNDLTFAVAQLHAYF
jgi:hypothetical protein